jgi:phosphopantetheinyl transferase
MPVYLQNQPDENTHLVLWRINEPGEVLMGMLNNLLHDHKTKTPRDNKHWLASRLCLLHLFPGKQLELNKDENNKPSLKVDGKPYHISITHSFDMAAILVSEQQVVALDLELIDQRIERVMYKFCNEAELAYLQPAQQLEQLTVIWSAKETLYKYYGRKELDFRKNLFIQPFHHQQNNYTIQGKILSPALEADIKIHVAVWDSYVLTMSYSA